MPSLSAELKPSQNFLETTKATGRHVIGQRDVFLYFLHLVGIHVNERIFLAVDRLDFQCREHLGKGHRHGIGTEGLPGFERDRIGHHTDLEAVDILQFGHRALAVGEVTESIPVHISPCTPIGSSPEDFLAGSTIEHRINFLDAGKQERQILTCTFLDLRRERRQRTDVELLASRPEPLAVASRRYPARRYGTL